jgi:DNA-binding NarL/FixJ family response regulator
LTAAPAPRENPAVPGGVHRVVVVEDHPIFRVGLTRCLAAAEPDFDVVGEWADGAIDVARLVALAFS